MQTIPGVPRLAQAPISISFFEQLLAKSRSTAQGVELAPALVTGLDVFDRILQVSLHFPDPGRPSSSFALHRPAVPSACSCGVLASCSEVGAVTRSLESKRDLRAASRVPDSWVNCILIFIITNI